jgi:predicted DNA-binding ribbon-helix-helix protein
MKSPIVKRSIVVAGHTTNVSLEDAFWDGVRSISCLRKVTLSEFLCEIDRTRRGNLSSSIRVFVLEHFMRQAAAQAASPLEQFDQIETRNESGAIPEMQP